MSETQTLLVFTNLPDQETAAALAESLVSAQLAACVNVLAPCRSVYRWQGALQEAQEVPVIIKTAADRYAALETFLRQRHPYQLPEIVAVQAERGLPAYLEWITTETRP